MLNGDQNERKSVIRWGQFQMNLGEQIKKAVNCIALLHFACSVIVWHKLICPHR